MSLHNWMKDIYSTKLPATIAFTVYNTTNFIYKLLTKHNDFPFFFDHY
ncbi:hypothetical protein MtrunA17_Chr5g0417431 [Medicago truncatula]|uniref:Uncharacterized protein n=1 Tax=Medicago truncatula TaxID=3880 RepID=A0A396HPY6_MEDTR|nr:hypothetical protein MtrunA17_Chr5g0417431 [Medicago truncatula]